MPNQGERSVKDLMVSIEDYSTITVDGTIRDAFEILDRTGHRAILVFDEEGSAVGQLSYRDILVALEPKYTEGMWGQTGFTSEVFSNYPVFYYSGSFSGKCKQQASKKVKEVMSPIKITVSEDATLAEAVHIMVVNNLGRLPVLGQDDKIVGMIRLMEIFDEVKKVVLSG